MSLAASLLQTAVTVGKEGLEKFEMRMPKNDTSIVRAFSKYTDQLVAPGVIEGLKTSLRRPVQIPVFSNFAGTIGTARKINPTPDVATTAMVPINFVTKDFSFAIDEAINADNYKSKAATLRNTLFNELKAVYYNSANSLEKQGANFLEANKYATPPAITTPGVTPIAGAYELEVDDYIIKAPVIMEELFMTGGFQDVGTFGAYARNRDEATYGKYNQRNLEQYADEMEYYSSREVTLTSGSQETHYVFPKGTVGMVNITEWDARNRSTDKDGRFEIVVDPWFGFEWGVYITEYRVDLSGTYGTGFERVVRTRYDFAADFGMFMAYSSVGGESPIVKMEAVATP